MGPYSSKAKGSPPTSSCLVSDREGLEEASGRATHSSKDQTFLGPKLLHLARVKARATRDIQAVKHSYFYLKNFIILGFGLCLGLGRKSGEAEKEKAI